MAVSNAADSIDGRDDAPDVAFQLVAAVYGGALLAGVVTTAAALASDSPTVLATTYAGGFVGGAGGGLALASVDRQLPTRLGRTFARRLALVGPVVPLGLVVVGAWLAGLESYVDAVALPSAILVFVTGHMLSQLAENRYVGRAIDGDPDATWAWEPPGSLKTDGILVGLYLLLAAGNAVVGNWLQALLWVSLGGLWVGNCLVDGRWQIGPGVDRTEIRFYDAGLVKRRPYTRSLVCWDEINHVRMQRGDVVVDRRLRDVRFGRGELEDPDAFLEAIDRRLAAQEAS
ncbi:hypothetical protein [Natronorubrum thiooxidans]|uniref:Uncharacterized protein n=1 Tax=Natronorubrum thiooxidans TaxID=308853 RepID=A0A1N7GDU9_9EURY|nr:hypothetical protein [Natronorubrum thiooxidans]SIS10749.1 hypothetical protein SAMN05421752_111111 [Natronorubrum thiooxidans]